MEATSSPAFASPRSTYPTAPSVPWMAVATPEFFSAPCVELSQLTVSPEPTVHASGAAEVRYLVKLLVVPEPSERWTTVILVDGRCASGLSALMSGSSQVLISVLKIFATVSGLRLSAFTPEMLNEIVIGAVTSGK